MKKILLVSYAFPPIQTADSALIFNFVKYLNCFNWSAAVLCAKKTVGVLTDTSISSDLPKNVSIYRTYPIGNVIIYIFQKLKILSFTYSRIGWIFFATREGKKILKKESIDIIISRSSPIVSHLVALRLKSLSRLYWIACFSDPWTQSSYYFSSNKLVKKIDEYLERKVMLGADKIVVTTEQTKRLFLEKYKIENKIEVIPNSYDPIELPIKTNKQKESKIVITHAGNFYGPRSPEPFLRALKLLSSEMDVDKKIKVKLIGRTKGTKTLVAKYNLNNVVQLIDTLPRKDALDHLFDSDILLLIDAPSERESVFLPSKLIEYINIKKPILAIVPAGASADLVMSTKTGVVVALDDAEGIKNAIKNYYELYKMEKLEIKPDWEEIKKYDAKNCAEALIEIAEKLINQKKWNGKRAYLSLSFDCDYTKDVLSLPLLLDILSLYSFKASFACIGRFIEKYPKEHIKIIKEGHEIINHTYTHPNNEELNPNQKFNELTADQKKTEIEKCHKLCKDILKYEPIGFRVPHFGNIHTEDIYGIHDILKELGYKYSSSTSAVKTPNFGLPFIKKEIMEFPLSNCPKHPFAVFDSWHSLERGNKKHTKNGEFYKLFKELIDIGIKTNSYINLYFDPMDVINLKEFKLMLNYIEEKKEDIQIATYKDIFENYCATGLIYAGKRN